MTATLNGHSLAGAKGATPNAINNSGYVSANPGFIWPPDGTRVDLRLALARANTNNAIPNLTVNNYANFSGDTFINDAGGATRRARRPSRYWLSRTRFPCRSVRRCRCRSGSVTPTEAAGSRSPSPAS